MSAIMISPSGARLAHPSLGGSGRGLAPGRTSVRAAASSHGVEARDRSVGHASGGAGLRLTARGRRALVLVVVLLLAGLVLAGRAVAAGVGTDAVAVETHTVAAGETLWGIAAQISGPDDDVRDVVIRLKELNQMDSADLMAGEQVLLPAQG